MKYETTFLMRKAQFEQINKLLEIKSLSRMTEEELFEAGAKANRSETIFAVYFEDGSELTWELCSGTENYYDDVIWTKGHDLVSLECSFELNDIEFENNGNTYTVHIELI